MIFEITEYNSFVLRDLKELKEKIEECKIGFMTIEKIETDGNLANIYKCHISLSRDMNYYTSKTRLAGAHKKRSDKTVGEVKEMLKTMTNQEVADELGISRSTLQRRLKEDRFIYDELDENF